MTKLATSLPSLKSSESGIVALITSIVVGLLLVVITASGIALMGSELRQSSDYDQSIKAYFAAESGVEDALAYIKQNGIAAAVANDGGCNPFPTSDSTFSEFGNTNVEYTCQVVETDSVNLSGNIPAEGAGQVDLSGTNNLSQVRLEWNLPPGDPSNWNDTNSLLAGDIRLPKGSDWAGILPAVMEVTVISYPKGNVGVNDITANTLFLRPNNSTTPDIAIPIDLQRTQPIAIQCNKSFEYNCRATLNNFNGSTTNYIISLHPRYSNAHYRLSAQNSSGTNLVVANSQLKIDVTARAGSVFRRIQVKAPLNAQSSSGFPYYSLFADDEICKVFEVTRQTDTSDSEKACTSPRSPNF